MSTVNRTTTSPKRASTRWRRNRATFVRAAIIIGFSLVATATTTWGLPILIAWAFPRPLATFAKYQDWTDGTHAGRFVHHQSTFSETIDFRRIIMTGRPQDQSYFNQHAPPDWAAVISLDMREGYEQVISTATGWPWRSAKVVHWISWRPPVSTQPPTVSYSFQTEQPPAPPPERIRGGWIIQRKPTQLEITVPMTPIWTGLVVNLATFATVPVLLMGSIAATATAQRRKRRARGQCIYCTYDLTATTGQCPECGKPSS
jgi:hypothetical protein